MISPLRTPGLFVIPLEGGVGKTVVAGAIADGFRRRGGRTGALVPVQTAVSRRREGLVSDEAEFLAACGNVRHPLDLICPQRYHEDLPPWIAARRARQPLDWDSVERSIDLISSDSDVMIVQAPGPVMMPLDEKHTVLDLAQWLAAPVVLVTRAELAMVSSLLLASSALSFVNVPVAGVVVNRYPADTPMLDQELSLREMEKWTKLSMLCVLPEEPVRASHIPSGIAAQIDLVDWDSLARPGGRSRRR